MMGVLKHYVRGSRIHDSNVPPSRPDMSSLPSYLTFDILRRIVEDYFGYEVSSLC